MSWPDTTQLRMTIRSSFCLDWEIMKVCTLSTLRTRYNTTRGNTRMGYKWFSHSKNTVTPSEAAERPKWVTIGPKPDLPTKMSTSTVYTVSHDALHSCSSPVWTPCLIFDEERGPHSSVLGKVCRASKLFRRRHRQSEGVRGVFPRWRADGCWKRLSIAAEKFWNWGKRHGKDSGSFTMLAALTTKRNGVTSMSR